MGPIRILSLADYQASGMRRARFLVALDESWHECGFSVITNHGIDSETVQATYRVMDEFFGLPDAVKLGYERLDVGHQRGYSPMGLEKAAHLDEANMIEYWHHGRELPIGHPYLPTYSANVEVAEGSFSRVVGEMNREWEGFEARTAPVISSLLDMPPDWFAQFASEGDSIARLIKTPALDPSWEGKPVNHDHTDCDVAAGVLAGKRGLRIWFKGQPVEVDAPPDAVIWNVGDMLQILSAGHYPSAWHGVIAHDTSTARNSIARFTHPPRSAILRPTGRFAKNADELWQRRICTAGWFLMHRLGENGVYSGPNPYAHEGTNQALFPAPQRPGVWAAAS